ncbi:MAG: hypothetical protein ACE5GW_09995, partial [Planctomycetota bacterium]
DGAVNVPLFSNREREVVGTLFRHFGGSPARGWGLERVRARLQAFTRELLAALRLDGTPPGLPLDPSRPRVIVCARGGERSAAVTAHLRSLGYPVQRLVGGYRAHRARVRGLLGSFAPPGIVVLNGLTGCGKTRVLREVARRYPGRVIDLEGLAGHRSSLLGDIGLKPVPQKAFESRLVAVLEGLEGPWTLIEWEARRIGDRELPATLYRAMRAAPQVELVAPMERRIEILCEEYGAGDGLEEIRRRLPALAPYPRIGEEGVLELEGLLEAGRAGEAARLLLERHYDPRYRHGNRALRLIRRLELGSFADTAARVVSAMDELRESLA